MLVVERISAPTCAFAALLAAVGVTDEPVGCLMASGEEGGPLGAVARLLESAPVVLTEASGVWSFGIVRNESEMYHGGGRK
jgi:hypothetical protein